MTGSELDGVIRQMSEPFKTLSFSYSVGAVRLVAEVLGSLFARRINPHITPNIIITNNSRVEYVTTWLWLRLHGIGARIVIVPQTITATDNKIDYKIGVINGYNVNWFYTNQPYEATYIESHSKCHARTVAPDFT